MLCTYLSKVHYTITNKNVEEQEANGKRIKIYMLSSITFRSDL